LLATMRASGTTILLITHQLGLLADIADEFLFLSAGELVSRSSASQVKA
jgi:ABC-type glutathione transport system ATPase component